MLAMVAAILFAIALIFELAGTTLGSHIGSGTFIAAGLMCLALHQAGIGTSTSWRRSYRRRRR
ncbi:MAG TPA: hypothetical protein VGQ05_22275 [Streptosporangiaceae bacterium]|jgi:hypothetical protein|nr:hypothetical protein [Streptosporangiaceae bacterium]